MRKVIVLSVLLVTMFTVSTPGSANPVNLAIEQCLTAADVGAATEVNFKSFACEADPVTAFCHADIMAESPPQVLAVTSINAQKTPTLTALRQEYLCPGKVT